MPGDKKKRIVKEELEIQGDTFQEHQDFFKLTAEKQPIKRIFWLYIFVALVTLALLSKLWYLQITKGDYNKFLAEGNRIRARTIFAARGVIYDKDGNLLVRNVPSFNLVIYPADLPRSSKEREQILSQVASIINRPVKEIAEKIPESELFSLEPKIIGENINRDLALILKEKLSSIPGVTVEESATRNYIENLGLGHILGYIGKLTKEEAEQHKDYALSSYIGKIGLEAAYEETLKGQDGKQSVEVDSNGRIVRVLASQESIPGNNLVLSLDKDLQQKMLGLMQSVVSKKRGKGVAIAMDPQTGSILGMVSLPDFNNNLFTTAPQEIFLKEYARLSQDPNQPLFNRAIAGIYPPGSTIKPLMAVAGLSEGVISEQTHILDKGEIKVPNQYNPQIIYTFPDWKPGGHGLVNVFTAIAESCDVFFYGVGGGYEQISGLGSAKIQDWFRKFNLGSETGVDLTGENPGLVPTNEWKRKTKGEDWYQGDTYHISIGQGDLLVSPLQLVNYISAIANGGKLLRPHLVSKILDSEGKVVKEIKTEVKNEKLADNHVIDIVKEGMRLAVTSGTARELSDLPVPAAGKTGTAEFDNNKSAHAWFTAFAPFDNPQIAVVVLVEGGGEGHETAVPVAKEILRYYFTRK